MLPEESFSTEADASKSKDTQAKSTGVGAGILVAVTGAEVIAAIQEDTEIAAVKKTVDEETGDTTLEAGSFKDVTVSAKQKAKDTSTASAGSAGGTSVSPALNVHVSGIKTEAYIGAAPVSAPQQTIVAGGDIIVSADSDITREVGTNAAAAGGSVGVGIAPVISVFNDSSRAKMMRGSKSKNLKVNAKGMSTVKSTARSGSKGAPGKKKESSSDDSSSDGDGGSDKGDSDKQADKGLDGAAKIAGSTGMSNIAPNTISNKRENRQTAETSEGNLQVAAAFNLSIFSNEVESYIAGDFTSETDENIEVTSTQKVEVTVTANASATGAKTGVGAAVALNIASYKNLAHVDQAALKAGGNITVKASLPEEEKKEEKKDSEDGKEEEKKEYDFTKAEGVKEFIKDKTVEYMKKAAEAMKMYDIAFNDTLKKHLDSLLEQLAETLTTAPLEELIKGTPLEKYDLSKLKEKDFDTYKDLVVQQISNNVYKALKENSKKLWDSVKEKIKEVDASKVKEYAARTISTAMIDCLADWITVKKEDESPANTFKTEAIAGAGASDVGVAGSIAIAVINGDVKAYIDSAQKEVTAGGDINIDAKNNTRQETTGTAAVKDDGSADKNLSDKDSKSGSENDQEEQTIDKKVVLAATKGGTPEVKINGKNVTVNIKPMEGY